MSATLAFAFAAGMLSAVNPYGFALLPAFLTYCIAPGSGPAGRITAALRTAAAVTAAFALVFTLTGLAVAAGLRSLTGAVPVVAVILGAALAIIGILLLTGRHLPIPGPGGPRPDQRRGAFAFGLAYAVGSLSCTLPVLLAVVAQATATASLAALLAVFAAYTAGAAVLILALAASAALTSTTLSRFIRNLLPHTGRITGAALALAGAYLIAYWAPVAVTGSPNPALAGVIDPIAATAGTWLNQHQGLALAAAAALIAAAAFAAWTARQRTSRISEPAERSRTAATSEHHSAQR